MKKIITCCLLLALLASMTVSAFAAGTVIYDGESQKFIFNPGSEHSPTDLFSDFKNLMPGDTVTQEITVRNDASNQVKVKIYVRALGAHPESADFLSQLHLTVAKSEDNEMAYMFDAAADQTDGMTDWVYLGTLYSGGEVNLVLNLEVPITLGDEYQDAIGYLDWEFKIEEFDIEPDDPTPPTGDTGRMPLFLAIAGFSGLCLIVLFVVKFRKKQEA